MKMLPLQGNSFHISMVSYLQPSGHFRGFELDACSQIRCHQKVHQCFRAVFSPAPNAGCQQKATQSDVHPVQPWSSSVKAYVNAILCFKVKFSQRLYCLSLRTHWKKVMIFDSAIDF